MGNVKAKTETVLLRHLLACYSIVLNQFIRLCIRKKWEGFLKEVIAAQCPLRTLSLGLTILSNDQIVNILRCKIFEDFAIKV